MDEISASFGLSVLKGDSLSATFASKSAQNFVRFRFEEFFANYFSADTRQKRSPYCRIGKAFNDVAAKKRKQKTWFG